MVWALLLFFYFSYSNSSLDTLLISVESCGVCFLVNRKSFPELRNKLRLDALPVTTIDLFVGFELITHCTQVVHLDH